MSNTRSIPTIACALFSLAAAGCQFFFPMPLDADVAERRQTTSAQAVRTTGAPFMEGEVLEARVSIEDVAAGSVTLRVGNKCVADGKVALPVTAEGHLGGLLSLLGSGDAETAALIDLDGSLPIEAKWDISMDDKRSFVQLDYATGRYRLHQRKEEPNKRPANSYKRVDLSTEQTPHDGHSLLGYLRRWDPPEGTHGFLYVVVGRYLLRVDVTLTGKETLGTVLGQKEAVRIDGIAQRVLERTLEPSARHKPRPFSMWLTADHERIPLRIKVNTELAELTIDLTKHTKGVASTTAPSACVDRVDKKALAKAKPRKKPKDRSTPKIFPPPLPKALSERDPLEESPHEDKDPEHTPSSKKIE